MSFTLKDIKGAVFEKKEHITRYPPSNDIKDINLCIDNYNSGISAQASVPLRFNREKLIDIIRNQYKDEFDLADAIIAADKDIIEGGIMTELDQIRQRLSVLEVQFSKLSELLNAFDNAVQSVIEKRDESKQQDDLDELAKKFYETNYTALSKHVAKHLSIIACEHYAKKINESYMEGRASVPISFRNGEIQGAKQERDRIKAKFDNMSLGNASWNIIRKELFGETD